MSLELSPPQQEALDQHPGEPLEVVDPRTNVPYVVLSLADYDRLRETLEDDVDRKLQKAAGEMAKKSAIGFMRENPY